MLRVASLLTAAFLLLTGTSTLHALETAPHTEVVISVADQKLVVLKDGAWMARYPVSTSKYGTGDSWNSYRTPLGKMRVCDKIGARLASGSVLKRRQATGEVLRVNAPGRDPIVTRILWLEGLEGQNANARGRSIYIHGTPDEAHIGRPVSYGCIRMRSSDVMHLFETLEVGAPVTIIAGRLPRYERYVEPVQTPEVIIASKQAPPTIAQTLTKRTASEEDERAHAAAKLAEAKPEKLVVSSPSHKITVAPISQEKAEKVFPRRSPVTIVSGGGSGDMTHRMGESILLTGVEGGENSEMPRLRR